MSEKRKRYRIDWSGYPFFSPGLINLDKEAWRVMGEYTLARDKVLEGMSGEDDVRDIAGHMDALALRDPSSHVSRAYKRLTGMDSRDPRLWRSWKEYDPYAQGDTWRHEFVGWGKLPQERLKEEKAKAHLDVLRQYDESTRPEQPGPGGGARVTVVPQMFQPSQPPQLPQLDVPKPGFRTPTPVQGAPTPPIQSTQPSPSSSGPQMFGGDVDEYLDQYKKYRDLERQRRSVLGLPERLRPQVYQYGNRLAIRDPETGEIRLQELPRGSEVVETEGGRRFLVNRDNPKERPVELEPYPLSEYESRVKRMAERRAELLEKHYKGTLSKGEKKELDRILESEGRGRGAVGTIQRWRTDIGRKESLFKQLKNRGIDTSLIDAEIEVDQEVDGNGEVITEDRVRAWADRINRDAPGYGYVAVPIVLKYKTGWLDDKGKAARMKIQIMSLEEYERWKKAQESGGGGRKPTPPTSSKPKGRRNTRPKGKGSFMKRERALDRIRPPRETEEPFVLPEELDKFPAL